MTTLSRFHLLAACVSILVAILPGESAANPISIFPPQAEPGDLNAGLDASEYFFHPREEECASESWFFMAHLNDDIVVFGFFGITNLGIGDRSADANVSVSMAGGRSWFARSKVKSGEVSAATDVLDIKLGVNRFWGSFPEFRITFDEGKIGLDLTYTCELPGWKPGSGKVILDKDSEKFYSICVPATRAKVTGSVTLEGRSTDVSGYGYSDHGLVTVYPHVYSEHWLSLRSFDAEHTVNFLQFTTPEEYGHRQARWILVGDAGRILLATTDFELEPRDTVHDQRWGDSWPGTIAFKAADGARVSVEGTVTVGTVLERLDFLSKLSFLERTIASFFARSLIYRFPCEVKVHQEVGEEKEDFVLKGVSEVLFVK
ncbi:hypothetical protein ACFL4G_04015 [Thermodesulfobacteriota bacterium]